MAKGLDDLINWLVEETAYAGEKGQSVAEFVAAVSRFSSRQQRRRARHGDRHGEKMGAAAAAAYADGLSSGETDMQLARKAWEWLMERPEILVGRGEPGSKGLSLDDVLALPEPVEPPLPVEAADKGKDKKKAPAKGSAASKRASTAATPPTSQLADEQAGTRPRLYATEQTIWYTVTGHDVDYKKIPPLEWKCLMGIASAKEHGILQGDLRALVNQDKRSVPKRTDFLATKGYAIKRTTIARGYRTSMLWLTEFAPVELPEAEDPSMTTSGGIDFSAAFLTKDLEPVPWRNRWTGESIEFASFGQTILAVTKAWGVIRLVDLKQKLGIHSRPWHMRTLARSCREFVASGVLRYVAAVRQDERRLFKDCINGVVGIGSALLPSWVPEKPLANLIYDTVRQAGPRGMTSPDICKATVGASFGRYMFSLMADLAKLGNQPEHLGRFQLRSAPVRTGKNNAYVFVASGMEEEEAQRSSTASQLVSERSDADPVADLSRRFGFVTRPDTTARQAEGRTLSELAGSVSTQGGSQRRHYHHRTIGRRQPMAGKAAQRKRQPHEGDETEAVNSSSANPPRKRGRPRKIPAPSEVEAPAPQPDEPDEPDEPYVLVGKPGSLNQGLRVDGRPKRSIVLVAKLDKLKDGGFLEGGGGYKAAESLSQEAAPAAVRRDWRAVLELGDSVVPEQPRREETPAAKVDAVAEVSAPGAVVSHYNGSPGRLTVDTSSLRLLFSFDRNTASKASDKAPLTIAVGSIVGDPSIRDAPGGAGEALVLQAREGDGRQESEPVWPFVFILDGADGNHKKAMALCSRLTELRKAAEDDKDDDETEDGDVGDDAAIAGTAASGRRQGRGLKKGKPTSGPKEYSCEKCGGTWKNLLGLQYHQTKARTSCNPNYAPPPIMEIKRKTRERRDKTHDREGDGSSLLSSPSAGRVRGESMGPARRLFGGSSRAVAPRGIVRNPALAVDRRTEPASSEKDNRPPQGENGQTDATAAAATAATAAFIRRRELESSSLEGEVANIDPRLRTPQVPKASMLPTGSVQFPLAAATAAAAAAARSSTPASKTASKTERLDGSSAAALTGFQMPLVRVTTRMTSFMLRSTRVAEIVKHLLRSSGGVFPSDRSLWYAVFGVYTKSFPGEDPPTLNVSRAVMKKLEAAKAVEEHTFGFRDAKGHFIYLRLLVSSGEDPKSDAARAMRQRMQESHPQPYVPAEFAPSDKDMAVLRVGQDKNDRDGRRLPTSVFDGLTSIRFLVPNTRLGDEVDEMEEGVKGVEDSMDYNVVDSQISHRVRLSHVTFTNLVVLRATVASRDVWPALSDGFFEKQADSQGVSFTMNGWLPGRTERLRDSLPQTVAECEQQLRGSVRIGRTVSTAAGRFFRDVERCRLWEMSPRGHQLLASGATVAPEHVFLHVGFGGEHRLATGSACPVLRWSERNQFGLASVPSGTPEEGERGAGSAGWSGRGGASGWGRGGGWGRGWTAGGRAAQLRQATYLASSRRELTGYPQTERDYLRGRATTTLDWSADETLIAAFVAIKTLIGGLSQAVDWGLLMRLFPERKLSGLRAFWSTARRERAAVVDGLAERFQQAFPEAYGRGELAAVLDYNNVLAYDWAGLVAWTLRLMRRGEADALPATREQLEGEYVVGGGQPQPLSSWREDYYHPTRSVWNRLQDAAGEAAVLSLDGPGLSTPAEAAAAMEAARAGGKAEQAAAARSALRHLVARSWLRALCATPHERYRPSRIKQKLLTLGAVGGDERQHSESPDTINRQLQAVIGELQNERVLRRTKSMVALGGRMYLLAEAYASTLDKAAQQDKFRQAAAFKRRLDHSFRADQTVELSPSTNDDGMVMALLNLQAHGRVAVEAVDAPCVPFGFEPGNYETRKFPKHYQRFRQRVVPTERYVYGEDEGEDEDGERLSLMDAPAPGPHGELPMWRDFFGVLDRSRFVRLASAVVFSMATRGGAVEPRQTAAHLRPVLEPFEVQMLIDWAVAVGILERGGGDECTVWHLSEWWWLLIGRMYEGLDGEETTASGEKGEHGEDGRGEDEDEDEDEMEVEVENEKEKENEDEDEDDGDEGPLADVGRSSRTDSWRVICGLD
ncbi:TFIIIC transcription initiation factor complex subunit [Grosmannia clavigera kw1407]|uniref:TFIIIC transcription initiation factor complex subunit n=1 Tax=Grosmannia clavigera (strain kw1407 / UAMH 11150) TaxID=655863 RepID=F0XRG9_GROCL|nr:TFIIIC transcription initiation factor complex subunit [Grosmannia clavigera kw1407]EFW99715.1 TFIIIC transcription initiation factor complex subunit [Grosmannia clavigera kw1407]